MQRDEGAVSDGVLVVESQREVVVEQTVDQDEQSSRPLVELRCNKDTLSDSILGCTEVQSRR